MRNLIIVSLIAAIGMVGAAAFQMLRFVNASTGSASDTVIFEVPSGASFNKITLGLVSDHLITSPTTFHIYAKLTSQEKRLKKGEYLLNHGMTPQTILDVLASGKSIEYPVTFPEGSNIYDMDRILKEKGFYKNGEFLAAVKDAAAVQQTVGQAAPSLEGYLFPETYKLTKFTTAKELVHEMTQNFTEAYTQLAPTSTVKLSKHEIVTLASVVEKETGAPEERPLVASIFYNRLAKGMPLQSDPTILYGIIDERGKPTDNITKADILHANRYNTYTVKRLPFGPIANPGREALAATLKPAVSEYLYFVSKNNGTHVFTKNYQEHLSAVKSFQLNPSARAGKSWRDLKKRTKSSVGG